MRVDYSRGETLVGTLQRLVERGSRIETDGLLAYRASAKDGNNDVVIPSECREELLPQMHLAVSLLKRWLLGTHQGAVRASHLDYYADEYTFRFNRRSSHSRGLLFRRVLEHAVQIAPVPEADLRAPG